MRTFDLGHIRGEVIALEENTRCAAEHALTYKFVSDQQGHGFNKCPQRWSSRDQ